MHRHIGGVLRRRGWTELQAFVLHILDQFVHVFALGGVRAVKMPLGVRLAESPNGVADFVEEFLCGLYDEGDRSFRLRFIRSSSPICLTARSISLRVPMSTWPRWTLVE